MYDASIRINCIIGCIKAMWHAFDHIRQLPSADVTHAAGKILSAILTQCFKNYSKCAFGTFAYIPVSDCD